MDENLKKLFGINKDFKPSEKEDLSNALNCCDNVSQMFAILQSRYNLEACKPGLITKKTLVNGLLTAFEMLKPEKRV
jgi:hypothetical protein